MKVFAKTDIGKIREINEDSYFIPDEDYGIELFIIADGMGGYDGGDIASSYAVKSAASYIKTNYEITFNEDEDILKLVNGAIEYANMLVYEKSRENEKLVHMGTTIDIILIIKNKLYIGHAGDSRVYRIRKEYIRKLTKDHSYVQELIDDGKLKEEDSNIHPDKNMITKAIGMSKLVEPDTFINRFIKGDILVMCSDGLSNYISDEEIRDVVKDKNIKDPAEELVKRANEAGGRDNITVIVIYND